MSLTKSPPFLRRGSIIREYGLTKHAVAALIEAGRLRPVYLRPGSRAYFLRTDVEALAAPAEARKT